MVQKLFGGAVASTSMITPQFEFVPQTLRIGNLMQGLVLGKVFAVFPRGGEPLLPARKKLCARTRAKTLAIIGRRYRAETAEETREPLPEHWLAPIHSIDEQEKKLLHAGYTPTATRVAIWVNSSRIAPTGARLPKRLQQARAVRVASCAYRDPG